jgi:hypothetical protein
MRDVHMLLPAGGVGIHATAGAVIDFSVGVLATDGTLHSSPPWVMLLIVTIIAYSMNLAKSVAGAI